MQAHNKKSLSTPINTFCFVRWMRYRAICSQIEQHWLRIKVSNKLAEIKRGFKRRYSTAAGEKEAIKIKKLINNFGKTKKFIKGLT